MGAELPIGGEAPQLKRGPPALGVMVEVVLREREGEGPVRVGDRERQQVGGEGLAVPDLDARPRDASVAVLLDDPTGETISYHRCFLSLPVVAGPRRHHFMLPS